MFNKLQPMLPSYGNQLIDFLCKLIDWCLYARKNEIPVENQQQNHYNDICGPCSGLFTDDFAFTRSHIRSFVTFHRDQSVQIE